MSERRTPHEVIQHYRHDIDEGERITSGFGQLELLRTREIVRRHLPDGALRVLDVGGATGVHAAWLAEDGHRVHVVDPIDAQIARVLESPRALAGRITAGVGDARQLAFEEASFDAVLLLGPLYHLTEREDRLTALAEARRVVKPGGPVFAAPGPRGVRRRGPRRLARPTWPTAGPTPRHGRPSCGRRGRWSRKPPSAASAPTCSASPRGQRRFQCADQYVWQSPSSRAQVASGPSLLSRLVKSRTIP